MALTRYIVGTVGAHNDALSAANTGSSAVVNTGGSGVLSNAESNPVGSLAAVMTASSTSGGHYFQKSSMSTNNLSGDVLFKIKTENSGQCPIVWGGTGSQEWQIDYNPTTNKLEFKDDASTTRWTSTPTLAADNATYYWLRWYVVNSATVGQFKVQLSTAADPTTMLETYTSAASFDTGGTAYTDLRIGPKCSTGTQTGVLVVGSWAYDPAATDVPAPYVTTVDVSLNVPAATMSAAGVTPVLSLDVSLAVPALALTMAAVTPSVEVETVASGGGPAVMTMAAAAASLVLDANLSVPRAQLSVAAVTPAVSLGATLAVPAASLTMAGRTPSVSIGLTLAVPAAHVDLAAAAPVVDVTTGTTVSVPAAHVSLAANVPTLSLGATLSPPGARLTLDAPTPAVATISTVTLDVPRSVLTLAALTPGLWIVHSDTPATRRVQLEGLSRVVRGGGSRIISANKRRQ